MTFVDFVVFMNVVRDGSTVSTDLLDVIGMTVYNAIEDSIEEFMVEK